MNVRQATIRDLIDDCVHCGFCLPSCPTYVLWGEEMDSPRGRIYLMREEKQGEPRNAVMVRHFDQCLGCLGCVTACPSGVRYGELIEAERAEIEDTYRRPMTERFFRELLYALFPHPNRLRALRPLLRLDAGVRGRAGWLNRLVTSRLPERLQALAELSPNPPPRVDIPEWTPPQGTERARAGLFLGGVQRTFFPQVNAATVRVLAAEGCAVLAPAGQGCCGALSEHAGRHDEARAFARRVIDTFDSAGVDVIVANVAGCGSLLKEYGRLLGDDEFYAERAARLATRVRDVSEFVQELGPRAERRPLPMSVVYHDACHLAHGQGIRQQPRQLLRQIPDLDVRDVPIESELCCGSAGTYNLIEPKPARALGERKARIVLAAGAELLVTANPG